MVNYRLHGGAAVSASFTALILLLIAFFVALGIYYTYTVPEFKGWKIAPPNGLFWQLAMFFFAISNMLHDVAFIRTAVVVANIFISGWVTFGFAPWPKLWLGPVAELHLDQFLWSGLTILLCGIPMMRQFGADDSKVKFDVKDSKKESIAEIMWRDWWRRSGVPRADFKTIWEAGELQYLTAGQDLPMWIEEDEEDSDDEEDPEKPVNGARTVRTQPTYIKRPSDNLPAGKWENYYYYVVEGSVQVTPPEEDGRQPFIVYPGHFLDAMAMMAIFGHANLCVSTQTGPIQATISENTTLVRWKRSNLIGRIVRSHGFAGSCMRMVVCHSTVDSLFGHVVAPEEKTRYIMLARTRNQLNKAPLEKNAAMVERSLLQQMYIALFSLRDFWDPSPHQRVVNSMSTGAKHQVNIEHLEYRNREIETLANENQIQMVQSRRATARFNTGSMRQINQA